ncbi:MAG: sulfatase [Candidatus Cryptobacteroides sp.]
MKSAILKTSPLWIAGLVVPGRDCHAVRTYGNDARPNILIMIADDISQRDFGCFGHPVVRTPNIDALAGDGIKFTNAVLSTSSSSPSRVSIMTGRYPHNTGACELHSPVGEEQISLARILKDAGYYTMQAGKWHLGEAAGKPSGPFAKDFDRAGGSVNDGGGVSGADRWVEFLQERPQDKPFFAWFAAHDAHRNWDDDSSMLRYNPDELEIEPYFVDDRRTREDFASYYYEVSRFDRSVGNAIAELKRQGIYDNTVIVVLADNGRPFARAKTRMIKDGLWTPLIVKAAGESRNAGKECSSLVSSIDLAPTLASVAGITDVPSFQGRDFSCLMERPGRNFRNYAFSEHNWHDFEANERMVCTRKYIYIENNRPELNAEGAIDIMGGGSGISLREGHRNNTLTPDQDEIFRTPRPRVLLYDYVSDISQSEDISRKKAGVARKLASVLARWSSETGDTVPDGLTSDWYDRDNLRKTEAFKKRGEMPGSSVKATLNNNSGPF